MQSIKRRAVPALLSALSLGLLAAAPAAAVDVNLRIEGKDRTIFEGRVSTDGHSVQGHKCDGTNNGAENNPGPTVTAALDDGASDNDFSWRGQYYKDFEDFFVTRIGPDENTDNEYWGFLLNYKDPGKGGCQTRVRSGDDVLWAFDGFGKTPLKLSAPSEAETGQSFTVHVEDGSNGDDVNDAEVGHQRTNGNGDATLRYDSPGRVSLKADASHSIRSNEQVVCVHRPNDNTCGNNGSGSSSSSGAGAFAGPITGPLAVSFTGLLPLHRYLVAGAPRTLRGSVATGGPPLTGLRIRLRRYDRGHCSHYSLVQRRFHPSSCTVGYFLYAIPARSPWSYTLPAALAPGIYTLETEAVDAAGRRTMARRVFYVVTSLRR